MRRKDKLASVEFRARATPLRIEDTDIVVLALHDISDQKRRRVLESTFLHDARNLLSGILSWSDVLRQENPDEAAVSIGALARQLRDLFSQHALLFQAEKGELVAKKEPINLQDLARVLGERFSGHPSGEGKTLVVRFPEGAPPLQSDQNILSRILSNMVVNALEATKPGATVEVRYETRSGTSTFTVHNPGVIPDDVGAANLPAIVFHQDRTRPRTGHLQHAPSGRADPGRKGDVRKFDRIRHQLLSHPPGWVMGDLDSSIRQYLPPPPSLAM